jgi:hypothetical protein
VALVNCLNGDEIGFVGSSNNATQPDRTAASVIIGQRNDRPPV